LAEAAPSLIDFLSLLNPHPNKTFTDKAKLSAPRMAMPMGKSHINCQQDTALPHCLPWHPRLGKSWVCCGCSGDRAATGCVSPIRHGWPTPSTGPGGSETATVGRALAAGFKA